ncbi:hypothetical protein EXIGLDRAFT_766286 [Exidia glandulosa HHB12029]|uniref:Uncharacterized protein n=1 Tax=Exidia glandulosa HHB12029 TaxID=1314781 RepID=A0A165JV15_EXIGL|nr:hypothetical protein EXIGLDRAFT_766286 [Exidia glandulosa HHB12029]
MPESRIYPPAHASVQVLVYLYPVPITPTCPPPDIDNRFADLLLVLERAGLHFVLQLATAGNILPSLQSQLRAHLSAMRLTFPQLIDDGRPWTPIKFFQFSEAEPWYLRAVNRIDLPDRLYTLDTLLNTGVLHTRPPHPVHDTPMLWLGSPQWQAPFFLPWTRRSTGLLKYKARIAWLRVTPATAPAFSTSSFVSFTTSTKRSLLTSNVEQDAQLLLHAPSSSSRRLVLRLPLQVAPPATLTVLSSPANNAASLDHRVQPANDPVPPAPPVAFDDAAYQYSISRFAACVTPSPRTDLPPALKKWSQELTQLSSHLVKQLAPVVDRKLRIRARTVEEAADLLIKYIRRLLFREAQGLGFHAGETSTHSMLVRGRIALAGPDNRRLLFSYQGFDVLIGTASGPGPAIAVLREAIRHNMQDPHLWPTSQVWKIPDIHQPHPSNNADNMQETGLLCALLLFHYSAVPPSLHPVAWFAMQSTLREAIDASKTDLLTLQGMPTAFITAWRTDRTSVNTDDLELALDSDVTLASFLALPSSDQEEVANRSLRKLLLGLLHGRAEDEAYVNFRKGFNPFIDVLFFPQGRDLVELTKFFWGGALRKPCDILGTLEIHFSDGQSINTSYTEPSAVYGQLKDAPREEVLFLLALHDWIEGPVSGDLSNAARFLKACTAHDSLLPNTRIQIEFEPDTPGPPAIAVCTSTFTVPSVTDFEWLWDLYSGSRQSSLSPTAFFDALFSEITNVFNAP